MPQISLIKSPLPLLLVRPVLWKQPFWLVIFYYVVCYVIAISLLLVITPGLVRDILIRTETLYGLNEISCCLLLATVLGSIKFRQHISSRRVLS